MKRAIVPNPPNPSDQIYRAKPDLWQQAMYQWMLQTKDVVETTNNAIIGALNQPNFAINAGELVYISSGVRLVSIDTSGNVIAKGTVTQNGSP